MTKLLKSTFIVMLTHILMTTAQAEPANMAAKMKMMGHVSPMPSLMMVVKHHEGELSLTDDQKATLSKWHEKNASKIAGIAKEIMAEEKQMTEATLNGDSAEAIQKIADSMIEKRLTIIKTKLKCRDNMRKILNNDQWVKIVALYTKDHM